MADKKKDKEFQWLQKQLTDDMHDMDKVTLDEDDAYEDEVEDNPRDAKVHNTAYIREMMELQQALATDVSEQVVRKQSPGKSKDTNHSQNDRDTDGTGKQSIIDTSDDYSISSSETFSKKQKKQNNEHNKIPIWGGLLISCACIALAAGITICGKNIAKTALVNMGFLQDEEVAVMEELPEVTATPVITATITPEPTQVVTEEAKEEETLVTDDVFYVLLLGIDSLSEEENADTIIIASMNVTDKTYHLIQVMRDLYVKIPGYGTEVISEAYRYGGGALLTKTLAENFDLPLESYLAVDFDHFTKIIDLMGGVTVSLTKEEAEYLNKTNYISQKANRTMVEGKQEANGDQVLGYCRIQEVPNKDDLSYDFGRVTRSKAVLNQLFQKVKKMSLGDLLYTMNATLPFIRTNLTKEKFRTMIEKMAEIGVSQPDSIRVPVYTLYTREKKNGQTVYIPDLENTTQKIHNLVYGEEESADQ